MSLPKPVEEKRLTGRAPGKDVAGRDLPEPVLIGGRVHSLDDLPCPPEIEEPEAREWWSDFVGTMAEIGMLDLIDRGVLLMAATQYAIAVRAMKVLHAQGYFSTGSTGQMNAHPALKILNEATDKHLRLIREYGGTALARSQLGLSELMRKTLAHELDRTIGSKPRSGSVVDAKPVLELVSRVSSEDF